MEHRTDTGLNAVPLALCCCLLGGTVMGSPASFLKTANVTYNQTGICRTLSVPLVEDSFEFGSGLSGKIWKKAVHDEVSARYPGSKEGAVIRPSELYVFRTGTHLMIGWFFTAPQAERCRLKKGEESNIWKEDHAELHFGAIGPDAWHLQLVCSISGMKWDSAGIQDAWSFQPFENESGWGAEVQIPLCYFQLTEGGMYFNLCRNSLKTGAISTWNPLQKQFHEVENFGELIFGSYQKICELRTGIPAKKGMSRAEFEAARRKWEIPAQTIVHGPYLSNPTEKSIRISWCTAGAVPAFLEYRKHKGSEKPVRVFCSRINGLLVSETNHFVQLNDLQPGTEYEYTLYSLSPVNHAITESGIQGKFRTLPSAGNFSFFCISDIHSDTRYLLDALKSPETEGTAFGVLLGDNLSHCTGREAIYRNILDPIVSVKRDWPLVFVRGNHEFRGIFASEYYNAMQHETGRTWYAFSCRNIFFMGLDSGEDHPESEKDLTFSNTELHRLQRTWMNTVTASEEYRKAAFRIVFVHNPPIPEDSVEYRFPEPLKNASVPPDLILSGHWHRYICIRPGSNRFTEKTDKSMLQLKTGIFPCMRMVLSTKTFLVADVSEKVLQLRVMQVEPDSSVKPLETLRIPFRKKRE